MAIFTGGSLPTINVSSNTLLNNAVTGIAGNLVETGVSVALSPILGAQLSSQLGLDPNAAFGNIGSIVTNGVVGTGQQYLNQVIDQSIVNSKALGPFGPLVGGLAQNAAGALTQGVSGLLTGQGFSGFGGLQGLLGLGGAQTQTTASAPNNVPSRAFPGAGDSPYGDTEANYEGFVYNLGNGGKDVVFSIRPATAEAAAQGASELSNPAVPSAAGFTEGVTGTLGASGLSDQALSKITQTAFGGSADFGSLGNNSYSGIGTSFLGGPDTGTSTSLAFAGGFLSQVKI